MQCGAHVIVCLDRFQNVGHLSLIHQPTSSQAQLQSVFSPLHAPGSQLEQFQLLFGRVSVQPGERYLGHKPRIRSAENGIIRFELRNDRSRWPNADALVRRIYHIAGSGLLLG
jgi:hypothetical protein